MINTVLKERPDPAVNNDEEEEENGDFGSDETEESDDDEGGEWIIGNDAGKYGGYGNLYKVDKYEEDVAKLILEVHGVNYLEDVSIGYLL